MEPIMPLTAATSRVMACDGGNMVAVEMEDCGASRRAGGLGRFKQMKMRLRPCWGNDGSIGGGRSHLEGSQL